MEAAIDGDAVAYQQLLHSAAATLRRTVQRRFERARLGTSEVEDVVQETLLAIHLKRHTWRRQEPIGRWISAIGRNKLIDALRRNGRHAAIPLDDFIESAADNPPTGLTAPDLERLTSRLNARQRAIVKCVSVEGYSVRETAGRLNMSEGAVRVGLHRALKLLAVIYRKAAG
jgi:RNA polymerase sigma-70 factor (ECF subfamily)